MMRRLALVAAALVLVEFAVRGPGRALVTSGDLAAGYTASRVWLLGGDPYDMRNAEAVFLERGGPPDIVPTAENMPFVYPAPTLAAVAPLALLRWRAAVVVNDLLTLVAVLLALWALTRKAGLEGPRAAAAGVACLALAPLQTGYGSGQGALPCAMLLILGWSVAEERPWLGGALASFGAVLKPHLSLPFLALFLVRPRGRFTAAGFLTAGLLAAVADLRLSAAGHDWLGHWVAAISGSLAGGAANDAAPGNPHALSMIHLEMLLRRFPLGDAARTALKAAALAPALALGCWRAARARDRGTELAALSLLCVVSLLSMYHRTYDAVLLVVPLVALCAEPERYGRARLWAAGLCLAAFLWPGAPVLGVLADAGRIPPGLAASASWTRVAVPHQVWALLGLEAVLVSVLLRPCAAAPAEVSS